MVQKALLIDTISLVASHISHMDWNIYPNKAFFILLMGQTGLHNFPPTQGILSQ